MQKKSVLLVHAAPNLASFQPLSVLTLAGSLQTAGYNPIIFDTAVESFKEVKNRIPWNEIVCVGISSWSGPQILKGLEVSRYVKENYKNIPVVWGGVHASLLPEQTAQSEYVDIVVRGEGEQTFLEILERIENGSSLEDVKGITYKLNGAVVKTPDREFLDLNNQSVLPYDLLDLRKYDFGKVLYYPTSRGCPFSCIFCYNLAYNKRKWRAKSAEKVLEELEALARKFNPNTICFEEDNFFVDKNRVEKICLGIIQKKMKFNWVSTCRADYLCRFDDYFLGLLKDSGCVSLNVGGESGSIRILQLLRKQITPEQIVCSAERCKKMGIDAIFSFIAGVPSETETEQIKTLDLIGKLWEKGVLVNGYFIATVVPGTPLFDMAKNYNLEIPDTLEAWGSWQAYINDEEGTPWLTKKQRKKLLIYAEIVRFFYITRNLRNLRDKKGVKKLLLLIFRYLIYPFLLFSAKFRWRHRFTAFPIELRLWEFAKNKYVGYY